MTLCVEAAHRDVVCVFFFFNDAATTEIYTLSLHDALPIYWLDARVLSIFEGTEETLALKVVGRSLIEQAG